MKVRYAARQVLQYVPGFAGWIHRRGMARAIDALRAQAEHQASEAPLLRRQVEQQGINAALLQTQVQEQGGENISLRAQTQEQSSEIASLRAKTDDQSGEIASLRARADEQGSETASLGARIEERGSEIASLRARTEEQDSEIGALRAKADAQGSEITFVSDRLATMHAETEAREAARAAAKRLQWKDVPQLEKQGLFIVGHARSGTSILLRALNTCPDVFLLGEANIHTEGLRNGFAGWFNAMHREFGNTRSKGTYCPGAPDAEGNGPETFEWLSRRFRYVGEKVALRSETLGYRPDNFFEFQARHFFTSHYLCIIRNPADVMTSNMKMFKPDDLSAYVDSYLGTLQLILEFVETFPNVFVLFHERIDQHTFEVIGAKLGVDLQGAFAVFEEKYQVEGRWGGDNAHVPSIDILIEAYRLVRDVFSADTLREATSSHREILPNRIRAMRDELAARAAWPRTARRSAS
jgi:hypothetical protein